MKHFKKPISLIVLQSLPFIPVQHQGTCTFNQPLAIISCKKQSTNLKTEDSTHDYCLMRNVCSLLKEPEFLCHVL